VLVVLVELRPINIFGDAIEVREEVGRDLALFMLRLARLSQQVVD
jgi:hypothetical protein